jgi:hypothetical protein
MSAQRQEQSPSTNLASVLQGYSDTYLDCRGIQHRWQITDDLHVTEKVENGEMVERHLVCERCTTVRRDRFLMRMDRWSVRRLQVLGASYQYPEDYLLSEMGMVESPREVLRSEQLRRSLNTRKTERQQRAAAKKASPAKKKTAKKSASGVRAKVAS